MKSNEVRPSRISLNLSQAELSRASGISLRQLKAIESGQVANPQPFTLRALSQVLENPSREQIYTLDDKSLTSLSSRASAQGSNGNRLYGEIAKERFRREVKALLPRARYIELEVEQAKYGIRRHINAIADTQGNLLPGEALDEIWMDYQVDFEDMLGGDGTVLWYDLEEKSFLPEYELLFNKSLQV